MYLFKMCAGVTQSIVMADVGYYNVAVMNVGYMCGCVDCILKCGDVCAVLCGNADDLAAMEQC